LATTRYIDASDARLAVEERGRGHPVLLLHGGLADRDQVLDMASCLTDAFRIVGYTARGQGDSTRDAADHSLDRYVEDMAAVADAISARPLVVGGGSMGAAVSLAFAFRFPERVRALVQIGPSYDENGIAPAVRAIAEPATHIVASGGFGALREAIRNAGMPEVQRIQVLDQVAVWEETFTPDSFVGRSAALASWRPVRVLEELDVPVLIVAWPDDDQHPLAFARGYADALPDAVLVEVGAHASDGRSANREICTAIRGFLTSLDEATREDRVEPTPPGQR
jgi:pimeloyl-ACP methyl ester carboxylesterase